MLFRSAVARRERGVTLIEMVIVLAVTAVIAGAVALFIARPIESYADATRRADLTDVADGALRRMARDLRTALPNSIRTTSVGSTVYLEFLPTAGGGRYRAELTDMGAGDILDFSQLDDGFDVIGTPPAIAAGDFIVVYNLHSEGAEANAYGGDNRATYSNTVGSKINFAANKKFPFASPGNRFHVVQRPVTYECNPTTRVLNRYWNYAIVDTPQPAPPGGASVAQLAGDVAACSFTYQTSGASLRAGVVLLELHIERADLAGNVERIRLFQQVHVNNAP
jgi:MSHA biogenesis protein MshO